MWFNFELRIPFDCWSLRSCMIFPSCSGHTGYRTCVKLKTKQRDTDTTVIFLWTVDNGPTLGEAPYE